MLFERKTKDPSQYKVFMYPLAVLVIFFLTVSIAGFGPAFYLIGSIFLAASTIPFLTFSRTRNAAFLAQGMFFVFSGLVCVSAPPAIQDKSEVGLIPLFIVGMYALMVVTGYLFINRKLKWRGQEVFELAAMPIEDTGDSFTARPRPTGQAPVSKTEMIRFIDFITTNLIAFAFREETRIVFVLALPGKDLPYLFGTKKDYLNDTWVSIDFDGHVSVNITQEDYLRFKQDLDFDQLCMSLGNVFIDFLALTQQGKESLIIDKMNALRLSPFV